MAGLEFEAWLVGPQNPRLGELLSLGWSGPCVSALEFTGERHQDVCSSESPWREKAGSFPVHCSKGITSWLWKDRFPKAAALFLALNPSIRGAWQNRQLLAAWY